jgi:hypothetical protein
MVIVVNHLCYSAVSTAEVMYHPLRNSMMIVNIELVGMWEETVMATFRILFQHLHRSCRDYGKSCNNLSQDS